MNILPIQTPAILNNSGAPKYRNNTSFNSRTSKFVEVLPDAKLLFSTFFAETMAAMVANNNNIDNYKTNTTTLKDCGIIYLSNRDNVIAVGTKDGKNFMIELPLAVQKVEAESVILSEFDDSRKYNLFNVKNYLNCVNNLKREDIFQKALSISNVKLSYISVAQRKKTAKDFEIIFKQKIPYEEFFAINNEIFYYDKYTKTLYGMPATNKEVTTKNLRTINFISDEGNNVIGYNKTEYDFYAKKMKRFSYNEQQEPSQVFPEVVNFNDKYFAEANRFGNINPRYRYKDGIAKTLDFISNKMKVYSISKDDLQIVKYQRNDNTIVTINYYDKKTGKSLVFDKDGNFRTQMEYEKNEDGEFVSGYYYL